MPSSSILKSCLLKPRLEQGIPFLLFLTAMVVSATAAVAGTGPKTEDRITAGALLMRSGDGLEQPAVRLGTDMDVAITGQTARVKVVQSFRNTSDVWVEATYLYPLPEDGAVDSLKMLIGQRVIVGEIKRRAEAYMIYQDAKAEGKKTGLVEQQRSNMFTNRIANIGPGETVQIAIEYQAPVMRVSGDYTLRLPLVVGPRYIPPASIDSAAALVDAASITAPVLDPRKNAPVNPVSIAVHLKPGFTPAALVSPYHAVLVEKDGEAGYSIRLADNEVPADRDFELRWRSAEAAPALELFREHLGDKDYLMAVIAPPADDSAPSVLPRDLVFVIDNSGSMAGPSMEQARASLQLALRSLKPTDRFNVIRFDDTMTKLFDHPVPATLEQLQLAYRYADSINAQGGTEMLPALKAALADATPEDTGRVRQIIFLTDGAISNETQMLATLGAARGRSRVFMVGIGSAPNNFLMSRMAEVGRGSYTNIGDTADVSSRMTKLLNQLTRPVMTDIAVTSEESDARFTPDQLPDLYQGQPLVMLAQAPTLGGVLKIHGSIAGAPWERTVDLKDAIEAPGVAKLWAKRRITDVEVANQLGRVTNDSAASSIAELGLTFSLVTRETSLVAVDHTPSRPEEAPLDKANVPLNLPHGQDFDKTVGSGVVSYQPSQSVNLPHTATDAGLLLRGGLLLLGLGLAGLVTTRFLHTVGRREECV